MQRLRNGKGCEGKLKAAWSSFSVCPFLTQEAGWIRHHSSLEETLSVVSVLARSEPCAHLTCAQRNGRPECSALTIVTAQHRDCLVLLYKQAKTEPL